MIHTRRPLPRGSVAAFGLLLAGAASLALPRPAEPAPGQTRGAVAATQAPTGFTWAMRPTDLGSVAIPTSGDGGWVEHSQGIRYRLVPSFAADPTLEVIMDAPQSGSDTWPERFLVQIPGGFSGRPFAERALVIGFHSFSVSEKQVFLYTDLPEQCAERGYMLLAPYGLNDTNFGHPESQESLRTVLHFLYTVVQFNYRRIYAVGFSMGALNALSFAMRHLDPWDAQVAGVVFHSGRLDLVRNYQEAPTGLQMLLADDQHFGGTPSQVLFEYERVSPARVLPSGVVYQDRAPVTNLLHIPVYVHANLAEPDPSVLEEALELRNYLLMHGANVYEDFVFDPVSGHSWDTLSLRAALDAIESHWLPLDPPAMEVFADREERYLYTEVRGRSPGWHANYRVEVRPATLGTLNGFAVRDCRDLTELALDLSRMGIDGSAPLSFEASSRGSSTITFVLQDVPSPPSSVAWSGGGVPSWSHDTARRELAITVDTGPYAGICDVWP